MACNERARNCVYVYVGIREGGRRLSLQAALVTLLLAGSLTSCATAASHATTAGHRTATTQIKTFAPYDAQGRLMVAATDVATGGCFTASIAAPSATSYRCFSGNRILDPCMSPPATDGTTPVQVACRDSPWSGTVVLHLTSALPAAAPIGEQGRPWAFVLDNGVRCVASTGTVPTIADVALPYGCTNGAVAAILDAHARTVTVDYGRPGATTLRHHSVRMMWRS